ncbi:hypothetical protein EDD16DRAFT_1182534 [Pisolithus croceorrhizus]|nr:hypothetical protein EDD16DRAFT_1182534 [Pisolithus croceorrhizus]
MHLSWCMRLADASAWICIAISLRKLIPHLVPSSHPKPFKCSIKARSAKAVELIRRNPQFIKAKSWHMCSSNVCDRV